ncbi:DDT domain-containing protein PTM-like isoform X2 [Macadamia integrifolia]|uniref:DDT domain-containing protein PTM-like isoform X2 n=1 Tax=Macadamia integrifolia TaxID=60698 RepID=UPI001C4FF245|nr:DDT domain-containing protein PTM-like isoform X2 [Macadamia integrifolia]
MEFVGRTLKKRFQGFGTFSGVVESYDSASGLFRIIYEDGDSEELELGEVDLILKGIDVDEADKPVEKRRRGRPKKRRRKEAGAVVREGSGNSVDSLVNDRCSREGSEDNERGGFSGILDKECGLSGNLKESVSANGNLSESVSGYGVLRESFNSDGLNPNVSSDEFLKKFFYSDENLEVNDSVGSGKGTQKVRFAFDLNSVSLEETEVENNISEGDLLNSTSVETIEENQRKKYFVDGNPKEMTSHGSLKDEVCGATEETQVNYSTGLADQVMGNTCLGMDDGVQKEDAGLGRELEREAVRGLESTSVKGCTFSMLQLEEDNSHAGSANKGSENDLGCPNKEGPSQKKRKRLSENSKSTADTLLRRSTRRARASFASTNHALSTEGLHEFNMPAVKSVSDGNPVSIGCIGLEEPSHLPPKLALPPSSKNLNLDEIPILDLFSVYSCLRSFSTSLFLSPFDLEAFVAAVKCKFANSLIDFIHFSILQTLKLHLEFLSKEGPELASNCLRVLNWEFLDIITWPVFLPAALKVEILRCLCDDVIEVEAIRLELNRRMLSSELDLDVDRNISFEVYKKKKDPVDDLGGSCLTQEMVVNETNDWNSDECCLCKMDGSLICCDGCPAAYHSRCVGILKDLLPEGEWYCPECVVGKRDLQRKSPRSLRGAEILGVDPYGRVYFGSCGYLLMFDSCDTNCSYYYYHKNDLDAVIEVLKSSESLYGEIIKAISMHWDISINSAGVKDHPGLQSLAACTDAEMEPRVSALHLSSTMPVSEMEETKKEAIDERKPNENGVTTDGFHQHVSESVSPFDSVTTNQFIEMTSPFARSEGSSDISNAAAGIQVSQKPEVDFSDKSASTKQESNSESTFPEGTLAQMQFEPGCYVNYYYFAQIAASVAEELMCKSHDNINDDAKRSTEEIISAQLKIICKKSSRFCWSNMERLYSNGQKESCGWCFSCKSLSESGRCLFNMSSHDSRKSEAIGLCSKINQKSHLIDVICQILFIEERLRGLLSGPWQNPHHINLWRKSVLKASNVAAVKCQLLNLESNLRRIALSGEWLKQVDSVVPMGSASHVLATAVNVSSKHGIRGKRARFLDAGSISYSIAAAKSGIFWWRGGKLSRQVFHWKVLPHSLASKGGRQAGYKKILGIYYADGTELAKRSRYIAWRAALEMSTSVPQLALLVRELDSYIRWDELENNQVLSLLSKESGKLMRSFKKVTVRRKCVEASQVKYLLDFGKRRTIPESVIKHGTMLEISSSERKKYWLDECHVPLNLLRAFEERKLARMANKKSPEKLPGEGGRPMKPSKKRGLSYLLSKGEIPENYQCGHCNKDLPVGEAVNCQFCNGFFHKRHVRKSDGAITANCMYTCHKCQDVEVKHTKVKMAKGKKKPQKSKKAPKHGPPEQSPGSKKATTEGRLLRPRNGSKATTDARSVQSQNSKKVSKDGSSVDSWNSKKALTDRRPVQSGKSKKVLRVGRPKRAVKKVKYASLQSKRLGVRKKGKRAQSKIGISNKSVIGISWHKRKRTQVYHAYWLNGLRLSRKVNDKRVIPFKERKLILPSKNSSAANMQYKCCLCNGGSYASTIIYIGCESCEDWFHGDAFGLTEEKLGSILGFKCHKCRQRNPPLCPHLQDTIVQLHDVKKDAEMQYNKDLSDVGLFLIGRDDKVKPPPGNSPCFLDMHASTHELKADAIADSDQIIGVDCLMESKEVHAFSSNDWKEETIPDFNDMEQKTDPDSNHTLLLECKTESEKTNIFSDELLVREGHPSSRFGENLIETEVGSLRNNKVETVLVEMTASSEMMLVDGILGDYGELPKQKVDAVSDSNQTLLLDCEIESEKQHIVSGELLVGEGYASCKSDENVIATAVASSGNNEVEDVSEDSEKVLVARTFDDSKELHNKTVLSSIDH